jgi:hypothetical protein
MFSDGYAILCWFTHRVAYSISHRGELPVIDLLLPYSQKTQMAESDRVCVKTCTDEKRVESFFCLGRGGVPLTA